MACDDPIFEQYFDVPPQSVLRVWVEGDPNEFLCFGSVLSAQPHEPITHPQLNPGPFDRPVNPEVVVQVSVQFTLVAPASARVRARVVKSDGSDFGEPYCREFTGTHGQTFTAVVAATT